MPFGSPRGLPSLGDCHHELRSPSGRHGPGGFRVQRGTERSNACLRRTGAAGGRSHHTQARRRRPQRRPRATTVAGNGRWRRRQRRGTRSSAGTALTAAVGAPPAEPHLPTRGRAEPPAASGQRSPSPSPPRPRKAARRSPGWAAGPGRRGPRRERSRGRGRSGSLSGRVIGAPWRSRELAATAATGAATARRTATQVTARPRREGVAGRGGVSVGVGRGRDFPRLPPLPYPPGASDPPRPRDRAPAGPQQVEAGRSAREGRGRAAGERAGRPGARGEPLVGGGRGEA